jgi:outer membrane protein assembly factor BamB
MRHDVAVNHDPSGGDRREGLRDRALRHVHPHRRTIARVALASAVAVALLAGIGGAIRSIRAGDRTPVEPGNVDDLQAAWTADVGLGPVTGLAYDAGTLYVTTEQGLVAFAVPCPADGGGTESCLPAWHGIVPDGPLSAPVVEDDRVYAGSTAGQVYAFPATCQASGCQPEWVGVAGTGSVSQPGVNDDFVYVTSDRLYAFPAACGTEDRACPAAWSASLPPKVAAGPPAVGGGVVIVASSSPEGGVFAFPAVCGDRCEPLWTGDTDGPATGVTISGTSAYVVARGQLLTFPLSCEERCPPSWIGTFSPGGSFAPGASAPPAAVGDLVYVGADDGTLWVFPASCPRTTCDPARSYVLSGTSLHTPAAESGLVFATSEDGTVHAVVDLCDPIAEVCDPPWSMSMGSHTEASPAAGAGALFAGDEAGKVHAFSVGTGTT